MITSKKISLISFGVFLIGGLSIGYFTLQMIMWAVWGAPTYSVEYIALFASIILLISAFVCLTRPTAGRILAIVAILIIGTLFISASASLVPAAILIVSPLAYLLEFGYFAILAFALFFPVRWKWSIPIFICCLVISGAFAVTTYYHRWMQGDLHWPSFVYFEWTPTSSPLEIQGDVDGWMTSESKNSLVEHGVMGVLRWAGSQGDSTDRCRVIIICRSPIPSAKELYYPKEGTIIYLFDGTAWKSIPDQPNTYVRHATLKPDGMLDQITPDGGTQGCRIVGQL